MELYTKAVFTFSAVPFGTKLGVFILLNALLILWFSMRRASMRPALPLFYLGLMALALYTQLGSWYQTLPARATQAEETTAKPRESLVNFFTLYDTYFASKYFVEVGYTGLHSATVYADSTSGAPIISTSYVKNLQVPETVIPINQALAEGHEIYQPRFTDLKWEEFSRDINYLRQIGFPGWLNRALQSNPSYLSPLWMHLGGVFSKYFHLSAPWTFDQTMDISEIMPLIDIALFVVACLFVWLGFGLAGMALTFIYFGINAMANLSTLGGGYMQLAPFTAFAVGLALIQIRHTFLGGLFLALAACMNGFLLVFVGAALACLLLQRVQKMEESHKPWVFFLLAVIVMSAALLFGSVMRVGTEVWEVYGKMLLSYDQRYLLGSVGHKIFAVFDSTAAADILPENPISYTEWANYSYNSWRKLYPILWIPTGLMVALSFWAARRTGLAEGILLIGTTALFFYGNLPKEVYVLLALLPASLVRPFPRALRRRALLLLFTGFWAAGVVLPYVSNNLLFNDFFLSMGLLVLLVFWSFTATITRTTLPAREPEQEAPEEPAGEAGAEKKPSRLRSLLKRKPKAA